MLLSVAASWLLKREDHFSSDSDFGEEASKCIELWFDEADDFEHEAYTNAFVRKRRLDLARYMKELLNTRECLKGVKHDRV